MAPRCALKLLKRLPADDVHQHQPYWAVRGHLLQAIGDRAGSAAALDKALALTDDPAVRAFLQRSRQRRA
jgi:RNA polymerase sigma-70 factor (ECF subfamily)